MNEKLKTVLALAGGFFVCKEMIEQVKNHRETHKGTKRILLGGVWEDDSNNIYNCHGDKIGKVIWEEGFK